jgi:hypothetical protein
VWDRKSYPSILLIRKKKKAFPEAPSVASPSGSVVSAVSYDYPQWQGRLVDNFPVYPCEDTERMGLGILSGLAVYQETAEDLVGWLK